MQFILERKEFNQIQELDWRDIEFVQLDTQGTIVNLGVLLPGDKEPNPEIKLSLQIIQDALYQPHIQIAERLRRQGLAFKIYRALIEQLGHLYSGKGRRQNPMVDKIWAKLRLQPDLEGAHSEIGDLVWTKENPDGEAYRDFIEGDEKQVHNKNNHLIEVTPNRYVYHTSNPMFRDNISKEGLVVKGKGESWLSDTNINGEVIFAVNSNDKKDWWDSTYDDDIYEIDTTNLNNKWYSDPNFKLDDKRILTFENIPTNSIKLIYKGSL